MTGFWSYYFAWYQGGVYGNLIASAITTGLVGVLAVLKVRQHLAAYREHERAEREAHREAIRADLAAHHEKATAHAAAQGERMQVVSDQIAALHARLDQQQGGAP